MVEDQGEGSRGPLLPSLNAPLNLNAPMNLSQRVFSESTEELHIKVFMTYLEFTGKLCVTAEIVY